MKQAIKDSRKDVLDVLKTLIFIDGLPSEFEVLKQVTLMNDDADFEKAKEDALQKDQRLQFEKDNLIDFSSSTSAFTSKAEKGPVCSYCHKAGHTESDCRKKRRDLENEPKSKGGKGGKNRREPSTKGKLSSTQSSANQTSAWMIQRIDNTESEGSVSMVTSSDGRRKMCIDSACTDHVHMDKKSVTNFDQDDKLQFRMADQRKFLTDGSGSFGPLPKVHVCDKFVEDLLSVNQL